MAILLKYWQDSVENGVLKDLHENWGYGDSSIAVTGERVFTLALVDWTYDAS